MAGEWAPSGSPDARPPVPPAAVRRLAGDALPSLERYAELLAGPAVVRGLIGPREVPRLWERHLLNCAVLAPLAPWRARCTDIGTGAGLPGVVLAILRPDLRVTLVEPLLRRTRFLDEVVSELRLADRVTVRRSRAEDLPPASADVIVARAVAPLGRLAGWCLPLLVPGGELLALKGAHAAAELAEAESELRRCGAVAWAVTELGAGLLGEPTVVIRVRAGDRSRPRRARHGRG